MMFLALKNNNTEIDVLNENKKIITTFEYPRTVELKTAFKEFFEALSDDIVYIVQNYNQIYLLNNIFKRGTSMLITLVRTAISIILDEWVAERKEFTAYDVTIELRKKFSAAVDINHDDVKDFVHSSMEEYDDLYEQFTYKSPEGWTAIKYRFIDDEIDDDGDDNTLYDPDGDGFIMPPDDGTNCDTGSDGTPGVAGIDGPTGVSTPIKNNIATLTLKFVYPGNMDIVDKINSWKSNLPAVITIKSTKINIDL